jgi:hypothetical protein
LSKFDSLLQKRKEVDPHFHGDDRKEHGDDRKEHGDDSKFVISAKAGIHKDSKRVDSASSAE